MKILTNKKTTVIDEKNGTYWEVFEATDGSRVWFTEFGELEDLRFVKDLEKNYLKLINKPVSTTNEQPIKCAYSLKSNPEKILIANLNPKKDAFENIAELEEFLKDKIVAFTIIG